MTAPSAESPALPVLYRGVFLVALATLLFEIALTRVLSFTIWYHFAYVVISTALLGFGASGTLLAVVPALGRRDLRTTLGRLSLAAAGSAAAFLLLVSQLPLHPMQILARPDQFGVLLAYQLAAAVPFFFSGLVVSLSLREAAERVDRLYFWDLLGAGLGCSVAIPLMNGLSPPGAALGAAALFAAAAAAYAPAVRERLAGVLVAVLLAASAPSGAALPFAPASGKELARLLDGGMQTAFSRWTALFHTHLVEAGPDARMPDSVRWGLGGPDEAALPRPCCYVTHDGTAGTPLFDLGAGDLEFLDRHSVKIPYLVAKPEPRVLVIGVGGGRDVIAALRFGASRVKGVELDPVTVELIRTGTDEYSGGFFRRPEIDLVAGEGRHFVRRTDERFDVIQITGVDTLAAEFSGAYVLAENYIYTVEAFHDYLGRLDPGGILSIITGHLVDANPRSAGRLVSVARRALLEQGVENPERHIAVVSSRRLFANVIVSLEPLSAQASASLLAESERLGFEPLLLPGHSGHPVFEALATASGDARRTLLDELRFEVFATTDDSPFFFRSYRWRSLWDADHVSPAHTSALGQIVLGVLLVTLSALGLLLILGPLLVLRSRGLAGAGPRPLGILGYFLALGMGFMLFEISLMQRFVLFLGYPTYSLSITLFSLLVFLGWGSFVSRRWVGRERVVLPAALVVLAALTLFYDSGLTAVQDRALGSPLWVRAVLSMAMLAPLGLTLGAFFPLGIRRAAAIHEDLVPWAWGINGCASVTGTVLAVILAMSFGFRAVWLLALGIYVTGVAALLATQGSAMKEAR